jgi:hypothetical protein
MVALAGSDDAISAWPTLDVAATALPSALKQPHTAIAALARIAELLLEGAAGDSGANGGGSQFVATQALVAELQPALESHLTQLRAKELVRAATLLGKHLACGHA